TSTWPLQAGQIKSMADSCREGQARLSRKGPPPAREKWPTGYHCHQPAGLVSWTRAATHLNAAAGKKETPGGKGGVARLLVGKRSHFRRTGMKRLLVLPLAVLLALPLPGSGAEKKTPA